MARIHFARHSCRICGHVERRLQAILNSLAGFAFFAMECWSTYYSESLGPGPSASYGTTAPLAPGLVCGGPFQSSATHMRIPSIGQSQQVTTVADKQSASASYWQVSCVVVLCVTVLSV